MTAEISPMHVIVFGGPNGSGKTSLIDEVRKTGLQTLRGVYPVPQYFINPDQVAKDLVGDFATQDERDRAAFAAAVKIRAQTIESKKSFAFETVMSHPSRINEMLRLKEQGYLLLLTFVTTDDPEKNVARVNFRFATGTTTGHFVPPERVRDRYQRTLQLLPKAVEVADAVFVYDNSEDFVKAKLQGYIENDNFVITDKPKPWVLNRLVTPLQSRENNLETLVLQIKAAGYSSVLADELRGSYRGEIFNTTGHYVAQSDTETRQIVIHDRLMLDTMFDLDAPPTYRFGEKITITYSPTSAPLIEH